MLVSDPPFSGGSCLSEGVVACCRRPPSPSGVNEPPPFLTALGDLRESFELYYSKSDQLSTREEVALLCAVRDLALRRAREADSGAFRDRAVELFEALETAVHEDPDSAAAILTDLGVHLRRGAAEDQALERAVALIEKVAKRKEVQQGYVVKAAGMVKVDSVRDMIRRVLAVARAVLPRDQARQFEGEVVRELRDSLRIGAPAAGEA